jgi:hypothetical protein
MGKFLDFETIKAQNKIEDVAAQVITCDRIRLGFWD